MLLTISVCHCPFHLPPLVKPFEIYHIFSPLKRGKLQGCKYSIHRSRLLAGYPATLDLSLRREVFVLPVFEAPEPLQIPSREARIIRVTVDAKWWLNDELDTYHTRSVTTHKQDHVTQKTYGLDLADTTKTISNHMFSCGSLPLPETRLLAERAESIRGRVDVEIDGEIFPDAIVFDVQYHGDTAPLTATFHTRSDMPESLDRFGEIVVGFLGREEVRQGS